MLETIPGLSEYMDPPAGPLHCGCETCGSCGGKVCQFNECRHGEDNFACPCPRCVDCNARVPKPPHGPDDVYCTTHFLRAFTWNYRLYWRIEARLKSWLNREG